MATIAELVRRLKRVENIQTLQQMTAKIILNDKTIKEEKINEFEFGRRPSGERIGTYSSQEYAIFKENKNPKAQGFVDLILTRDFTNAFYLKNPSPFKFLFDSSDDKASRLFGKYGDDLKAINPETFEALQRQVYAPLLIKEIKRITQL